MEKNKEDAAIQEEIQLQEDKAGEWDGVSGEFPVGTMEGGYGKSNIVQRFLLGKQGCEAWEEVRAQEERQEPILREMAQAIYGEVTAETLAQVHQDFNALIWARTNRAGLKLRDVLVDACFDAILPLSREAVTSMLDKYGALFQAMAKETFGKEAPLPCMLDNAYQDLSALIWARKSQAGRDLQCALVDAWIKDTWKRPEVKLAEDSTMMSKEFGDEELKLTHVKTREGEVEQRIDEAMQAAIEEKWSKNLEGMKGEERRAKAKELQLRHLDDHCVVMDIKPREGSSVPAGFDVGYLKGLGFAFEELKGKPLEPELVDGRPLVAVQPIEDKGED